jgi:hypothetical protein
MSVRRNLPLLALVVKWPAEVTNEMVIRQVIRRLVDAGLPATWSVEDAAQAESLHFWGAMQQGGDAALLVEADALTSTRGHQAAAWGRRVSNRLKQIRSVGVGAETMHAGAAVAKTLNPQSLSSAGISAVVADIAGPAVRPLPLGMWQFTPRITLPVERRWWQLFHRSVQLIQGEPSQLPTVATIDLSRLAAIGPRAWQACDVELASVADANKRGALAIGAVAEIAASLAEARAAKPQRSILRAAA